MRANLPDNKQRFTKSPGRKRTSPDRPRLTPQEHQTLGGLVLRGPRASPGRLRAWANTLDRNLVGDERVKGNPYNWLAYRISRSDPMLVADAVKIYVAGLRVQDGAYDSAAERDAALKSGKCLHSVYEWQMAFAEHLPVVQGHLYGYGVKGRFVGVYDAPFIPVMLPPEYIPTLSEELANLVVPRDDGKRRTTVGEKIEAFFSERVSRDAGRGVSWNFSAHYAVEQIAMRVLFRDFYRGRFGPRTERLDTAINEAGLAIARELQRTLSDAEPRAFERTFARLSDALEQARKEQED
jgi:hypothetical protein